MRARLRPFALVPVILAAWLAPRAAAAFVRGVSDAGAQLYWSSSCETATIYLNGFSQMTPDEVAKSVGAAAAAWGPDQVTCPSDVGGGHPYFEIIPELATGASVPAVGIDGKNAIIIEPTNWDPNIPSEVLAYTTTFKQPNGSIVEADIAINATNPAWEWANLDPDAPPGRNGIPRYDLQTVMTHEFGHFLGLAHTCVVPYGLGDDGSNQPNDAGQMLPSCTDMSAPEQATVMWGIIDSDTTKRTLTDDDARGVCTIYPAAQDPHSCTQNTPDDGCGCAAAGGRQGWMGLTFSTLLLLAACRSRRRRPQD